jgi:hypothetical protein
MIPRIKIEQNIKINLCNKSRCLWQLELIIKLKQELQILAVDFG